MTDQVPERIWALPLERTVSSGARIIAAFDEPITHHTEYILLSTHQSTVAQSLEACVSLVIAQSLSTGHAESHEELMSEVLEQYAIMAEKWRNAEQKVAEQAIRIKELEGKIAKFIHGERVGPND